MRLALFLLFIAFFYEINAQENADSTVWVKLTLIDQTDGRLIEHAKVVSYETVLLYETDAKGSMRNYFNPTDSLKIAGLGYEPITVKVKDFQDYPDGKKFFLKRRTLMIESVDVRPTQELHLHLPGDIKLAEKKDDEEVALTSSLYSNKPGILSSALNPVGFVKYHTSKKKKFLRKAGERLEEAAEQEKLKEVYNRDIVKEVSGYTESDMLNNFIVYCNVNLKVSSNDNPIMIKQQILELKKKFEAEKLKPKK